MKIYLRKNSKEIREGRHGIDYDELRGIKCGEHHEYVTTDCRPIYYTEDEIEEGKTEFIEITPVGKKEFPDDVVN